MGEDLVSRVRDRLDQWEAAARAAFSNQADPENGWGCEALYIAAGRPFVITPHVGMIHEEVQARHVKAWNPATIITLVAGLRAALDEHGQDRDNPRLCESCGCPDCAGITYPCPTVRALACAVGIPVEEADR